ncbi:hypothetical protein [Massilibacterium senegalense]|uniref:hypothetical protein n=1 Tax=Massilibacterium senegalense TaxID=1632858 RepID=UPI000785E246|nr:hypothetical protein [Massilibacterium senegalense]
MQIQNDQIVVAQGRGKERPVELKKGEVYQVKVKETRLGEATVQLRGKEIQIAVTGALKAGEEATVEVIGERNGKPVMKPLPNVPVAQKNIAETTFQVKHVNKDVNQALDSFFKQGVPLTKETVADLQQFFKQAKGTDAEKLQTAQALATKQLVPTSAHLKAVHEALFGEPLQKTLQNVAKALNVPLETTKENPIATLKQKIEKEPQRVIAIVKEALQSLPEEVQRQVKVAVEEAEKNPTKARKIVVAALEKTLTLNQHEIKNGVREQMSHQSQGTKTEALHQKVAQTTTKEQAMDMIREAIQSESWTKQERAFLARAIQTAETLPENSRDYLLKQIKAMDTVRQIKEMSSQPHVRENVKDLKEIIGQIESLKGTVSLKESIEKVEKQIQVGRTVEAKEMLTKAVRDFEKSVQQPPTHSLEKIGQMKETFAKEPNFLKAIERMTTQMRESSFSVKSMEKTEQLLQQAAKLYKDGHVAKSHQLITQGLEKMTQEVLGQMKQEVIREPNSQKAIETVKRVANQSTLSKEISNPLQKVVQEAEVLAKVNRGQEAKSRIVNQLNQLISSHQSVEKAVHLLKQIVEKAETGQKAVEHVQKEVSTRLELPKEIQSKVNQALKESEALVKIGHDNEAKVHLQKQLDMVTSAKSVDLAKILDQFTRESTIQKAIKTVKQVATNETLPREVTDKLQKAIQTAETFVKLGQGAEAKAHLKNQLQASIEQLKQADIKIIIDQAKNQISREPSVQKAMEIAKQVASNSTVPKEIADRLQKVIQEVDVLTRMGRGIAAKTRLENQLTNISNQLAKNESPAQAVETMKQVAANESTGQKAAERVRQELAQRPELPKEIANKITQALKESDVLIKIGRDTEAKAHLQKQLQALTMPTKQVDMQATLEQVTREPNVQKAIETVKQVATNPTLPKEVADKLQQAVQTAETFVKLGRGTEAKAQLQNQLQTVATKNSPAQTIETLKQIAANESTGQKAVERVRQELAQRPELPKEIAYKVTQALKESDALVKAGRDAEAKVHLQQQLQTIAPTSKQVDIPSTIEQVNREPNVQKAIETVKQVATNPTLSKEVADKVQQAVQIAETFAKVGRIPEAKEQLQQVLQSVANTPKSQQGVQQLEQVAKTTPVDRAIQKISDAVSESTELPPEVKAKVQETVQQVKQLLEEGEQAESKQLLQDGLQQARVMESKQLVNPSPRLTTDQVETLQKQLQKEPSVEKMIQSVLKEVQNIEKDMPELSKKVQEKLEEATSFKEKGREMKARNAIQEAVQEMMTKAEKPVESNAAEQLLQQQEEQQWMQSVQHFTSKDLVVTRVTEKLAQAAIDFKQTKRDLMKNLDSINFLTKQFQKNAAPQIRQMLESTIKTLDQTILKSDMMMLTDMKTEKQLIQASSQLAEAKKLLDKGDLKGVQTIVRDVKSMLERLQFKPQDVRIQHFVMQEEEAIKMYKPQEQLIRSFTETLRTQATFEHSARGVYEQVRTMGLNYDSEVGQMLVSEKDMNLSKNMKQALLQLAEQQENTQVRQAAEQALNNVTGQQLLSKSDHGTTPQHLFFSLPLLLNKNVQNLQVYVNSKNQGEKVDWENCSLYFLLDTNKLGETGVLVNVVDRQLSVTLKNNLPDFEEKVSPLVEKATKRLEEVGYNMSSIQFRKLATEKAPTTEQETTNTPPSMPIFTEKGFDFTI